LGDRVVLTRGLLFLLRGLLRDRDLLLGSIQIDLLLRLGPIHTVLLLLRLRVQNRNDRRVLFPLNDLRGRHWSGHDLLRNDLCLFLTL
jgi:hypothetical protein